MARLTVQEQDQRIRRDWPSFKTVCLGNGFGMWLGRVYGLSAPYEVSIIYVTNHYQDGFEWSHSTAPEVRVLSPAIHRRAEEPEVAIPHVYDEGIDTKLCLFDPAADGWNRGMAIADTTIPWIADWLRFYEAWQATGVWRGGGRAHEPAQPRNIAAEVTSGQIRRAESACGCAASRCTIATRIVDPLVPAASWQIIDLVDFAAPAIVSSPENAIRTSMMRLAA